MKRLLPALLLTLLAAGCSGGSDVAATVNGTDFESDTVRGFVSSSADDVTDEQFLDALTAVVQITAIGDAAKAEFEIDPTDDEVAEFADQIFAAQGAGLSREQFLETQQVSEEGFTLFAGNLLVVEQVLAQLEERVEVPTPEEAQQLLVDDPRAWTLVCAAHILVATEEEALAIKARLADGEDFAELATELSTDTGSGANGGDLGCTPPNRWVDPFAEASLSAELGTVTDPVESQFGFHLIRVDSRTEATTEELQEELTSIRLQEISSNWYLAAVVDADVTVSAEYGTWETDPVPTIVPPAS
ncbi:MAG: peptidylprolyl isomerase [Acidimicrobiia bacterium]|nr:peptidylprolyl isomerase [Acidimicrobiia bacterium]